MKHISFLLIGVFVLVFALPATVHANLSSNSQTALEGGCTRDEFGPTLNPAWSFVDPLGDSSYSLSANPGHLRISTSDWNHDLTPGNVNAPRMLQTLSGDFDARTGLEANPSAGYQSAGILIWMDASNYIWVGRSVGDVIGHRYLRNGSDSGLNPANIPYAPATVHFRVTRTGNTFTTYYSSTGTIWVQSGSIEYPAAPASLQVGMFLINQWADNAAFEADFDYFTVNCTAYQTFFPNLSKSPPVAHNEKIVLTLAYVDATPLYDIDAHQAELLTGLRRASTWHGYDRPDGIPSLGYSTYGGQVLKIYEVPPYRSDNGLFDYAAVYSRFDICEKVQAGLIDEVWIWESGSGHAWEWVTNGPTWSWTWGSNVPNCGRTVTTLNFNYQREIDVAYESFHHRMEGAFMTHRPCDFYTNTWPWTGWPSKCSGLVSDLYGFVARPFSGNSHVAVCGDAHHPPNILDNREYVYDDTTTVTSICKDWRWSTSADKSSFNCTEWGCTHAGFHIWWMQNLPGYGNNNRDRYGVLMPDWWEILFN